MAKVFEKNTVDNALFFSAGFLALAFLGGVYLLDSFVGALPPPQIVEINLEGSTTAGLRIIMAPILVIWAASLFVRVSDSVTRRYLLIVALLFFIWNLIIIVKYPINSVRLTNLLWYLFYLPILCVPTLILLSCARAASLDKAKYFTEFKRIAWVLNACLLVLVLTNDLHQQVFQHIPLELQPYLKDKYMYELGYWVIFSWVVVQMILLVVTLFLTMRKQQRSALIPLIILLVLLGVYSITYNLRITSVITRDFVLSFNLITIAIVELTLFFGLLPSYAMSIMSHKAFEALPFDLKIFSPDKKCQYKTGSALSITQDELDAISSLDTQQLEPLYFNVPENQNKSYVAFRLHAGFAVLSRDIHEINLQRQALRKLSIELERQNALLEQNWLVQSRLHRQAIEKELLAEIEQSLQDTFERIKVLLAEVEDIAFEQESPNKSRQKLMEVKLLVGQCKRMGQMVLNAQDQYLDIERLQLIIEETTHDMRSVGIDSVIHLDRNSAYLARSFNAVYGCCINLALVALACHEPAMLAIIRSNDIGQVELKATLNCRMEELKRGYFDLEAHINKASRNKIVHSFLEEGAQTFVTVRL